MIGNSVIPDCVDRTKTLRMVLLPSLPPRFLYLFNYSQGRNIGESVLHLSVVIWLPRVPNVGWIFTNHLSMVANV